MRSPRNIPLLQSPSPRKRSRSAKPLAAADGLVERFADAMTGFEDSWPGAVAVSGGGDSIALMSLLAEWARDSKKSKPVVLSVDHGLRKTSAADAKRVVRWARAFGLHAHILKWRGAKPKADIEAQAREARYCLMGQWCHENGIAALYVAHTLEDQAETFLLRLGRGSGLDGLSGMRTHARLPVAGLEEITVLRPLLGFSRAELRAWLKELGREWIEDPMNSEPRFARSRVRALLPALESAGIPLRRVADAAAHLARARQALEQETTTFLLASCRFTENSALLNGAALAKLPPEIGLRALAQVLGNVSGSPYRPRFERLERLFSTVVAGTLGGGATLQGCRIAPAPRHLAEYGVGSLVIAREAGTRRQRKRFGDQINRAS